MSGPEATPQSQQAAQGINLLLADAGHVAAMLDVSERLVWAMDASGRLGPMAVGLGRRKLWCVAELGQWVCAGCPERQRWQEMKSSEYN